MKYFTDNPLERLMMQVPKGGKPDPVKPPPEGHHCFGCSHCVCVLPCYRDILKQEQKGRKSKEESL